MKSPIAYFHESNSHTRTGNFEFLQAQVIKNRKLTQLVQPILPQEGDWQVVCYEHGVLSISSESQTMVNKLRYLQHQYVKRLKEVIDDFEHLTHLNVLIADKSHEMCKSTTFKKQINADTQQMLKTAATFVNDDKLKQALLRLATDNDGI